MNTTDTYDDDAMAADPAARNPMTGSARADATSMRTTATTDAAWSSDSMSNGSTASTTVAAVFADRERAHDAIHHLHDEGFHETWIGITRSDAPMDYSGTAPSAETRVESENWFTRFFGEGDESLHDALVRHGVAEADAQAAGTLPAHSAIVTVDGANHPELAVQIITGNGGQLITRGFGATGYGTPGRYGVSEPFASPAASSMTETTATPGAYGALSDTTQAGGVPDSAVANTTFADTAFADTNTTGDAARRDPYKDADTARREPYSPDAIVDGARPDTDTSDVRRDANPIADTYRTPGRAFVGEDQGRAAAAYDDYGKYRAGMPVDESTRLQLREERLRIDKSLISRGEATVGTDVVTETQNVDVPVMREELFVERRPAGASAAADTTPIGGNEVIRVPLSQEDVRVTKVPFVTEEVVVGKRQIEEVRHISETTRKEQLNVTDANGAGNTDDIPARR